MATLGWQADSPTDTKEDAIDPALRETDKQSPMSVNVRLHSRYDSTTGQRLPSPPPIATLHGQQAHSHSHHSHSHSPAPSESSQDRSSINTPPVRRSPHLYPPPYQHIQQHPAYMPYPHFDHHHHQQRYDQDPNHPPPHPHPYHPHPPQFSIPTMNPPPPPHRDPYHPYPVPGSQPVTIVHTDDAATKLSDRVRRRCFNCCTTDTSTWRRSNLSPGKVLCNKCGLFERTHSRPRPEQFPHKRGPLATSTLRGRTPPSNQLPPISPPANPSASYYPPPSHSLTQDPRRSDQGPTPPAGGPNSYPSTNGTSGSNSTNAGQSLPGLQTWHASSSGNGNPSSSAAATTTASSSTAEGGGGANGDLNGTSDNGPSGGSPHISRKGASGDSSRPHSNSHSRQASPSPHLRAQTIQHQESSSGQRDQGQSADA